MKRAPPMPFPSSPRNPRPPSPIRRRRSASPSTRSPPQTPILEPSFLPAPRALVLSRALTNCCDFDSIHGAIARPLPAGDQMGRPAWRSTRPASAEPAPTTRLPPRSSRPTPAIGRCDSPTFAGPRTPEPPRSSSATDRPITSHSAGDRSFKPRLVPREDTTFGLPCGWETSSRPAP